MLAELIEVLYIYFYFQRLVVVEYQFSDVSRHSGTFLYHIVN